MREDKRDKEAKGRLAEVFKDLGRGTESNLEATERSLGASTCEATTNQKMSSFCAFAKRKRKDSPLSF